MIDRSCKFSIRLGFMTLGTLLLMSNIAWAQAPSISWSLDAAIKQIERQARDFNSAMATVEQVRTSDDGSVISNTTGTGFIRKDGNMRYNIDGGQQHIDHDLYRRGSKPGTETGTLPGQMAQGHRNS